MVPPGLLRNFVPVSLSLQNQSHSEIANLPQGFMQAEKMCYCPTSNEAAYVHSRPLLR